jgi:hypothetical protein
MALISSHPGGNGMPILTCQSCDAFAEQANIG